MGPFSRIADPPLRLVAIGCGRVFARYHLPAILRTPGVSLVGACDIDPDRRVWFESVDETVPCVADAASLLDRVDSDAALVCTPPETHADAIELCLARRQSVLVEKPMATTVDDARRLLGLVPAGGRTMRVGFNRRFRPEYAELRELRDEISHISFVFIADARRWNPGSTAVGSPAVVLHDAGSHAVDLIAHLSGRRIRSVRAESFREDNSSCVVRVEARFDGGVTADCTVGHAPRYEESVRVDVGDRLYARDVSGGNFASRLRIKAGGAIRRLSGGPTATDASFRAQLAAFAAACRGQQDAPGADAGDGFRAVAAIEACTDSLAHTGTWREVT